MGWGYSSYNDSSKGFFNLFFLIVCVTVYLKFVFWLSLQVSKSVMSCVTQEVKDLYHLMEHEYVPLDLPLKVQPLLTKISKFGGKLATASSVPEVQLSQYVPALEKLATLRLLQQVHSHAWDHHLYVNCFTCRYWILNFAY